MNKLTLKLHFLEEPFLSYFIRQSEGQIYKNVELLEKMEFKKGSERKFFRI